MTPDEQIALVARLVREHIAPSVPEGTAAILVMVDVTAAGTGRMLPIACMSNAPQDRVEWTLRRLLTEWERQRADVRDGR